MWSLAGSRRPTADREHLSIQISTEIIKANIYITLLIPG